MSKSLPSPLAAPGETTRRFNFNKLQAVLCIVASAAISVTVLYWIVRSVF